MSRPIYKVYIEKTVELTTQGAWTVLLQYLIIYIFIYSYIQEYAKVGHQLTVQIRAPLFGTQTPVAMVRKTRVS